MSNFFIIRQTKEEWEAQDTPAPGNYIGVESDVVNGTETGTLKAKLFNGGTGTPWNGLPYWNPSGLASNADQSNAMYVAQSDSIRDALDDFAASTSYTTLVFPSGSTYTSSDTLLLDALVGKTIIGNGAIISMTGSVGTQYGLRCTGVWQNSSIRGLHFTGNGATTQIGIGVNTTGNILSYQNVIIDDCTFGGALYGAVETEQGTSGCSITNNRIDGSNFITNGIAIGLFGEYTMTNKNFVFGAPNAGILIAGGNNRITNNTLVTNRVGIKVDALVPNSAHGLIGFNSINHSLAAGIWINSNDFSMDIIGNEVWATTGDPLGNAPFDTSFGLFMSTATNINIRNNTFGRNAFSLGYFSVTGCNIQNNDFIGVNNLTTNHIKNFGGTNSQNTISGNEIDDQIAGTAVIDTEATMYSNRIAGSLNEYAVVANNVTNATATMANITGLTVPMLLAGRTYSGEVVLKCSNSTAAEGISVDFDGGTLTATAFEAGAGVLTGGTTVAVTTVSSALATDLNWTTITGETWITIKFTLTVNTLGSLQLRFCEGTAHTSGTATVSKGSYMKIVDVTAQ